MQTEHELKKRIMRRVYGVYVLRRVTNPVLRAGVLAVVLFALSRIISIQDVFANALSTNGLNGFVNFVYSAVTTTETQVLLLASISIALALWFIADQTATLVRNQREQAY